MSSAGSEAPLSESSPSVAFRTLGCRLNQCETAQMEESLVVRGYRVVSWEDAASVRVLNTCTVTAKTDRECRREIRRAKRKDPGSIMAVTGCYAQVAPEKVAGVPGVDLVVGNPEKSRLVEHLAQVVADRTCASPEASDGPEVFLGAYGSDDEFGSEPITYFSGYTRAFLKVQSGCDAACAYCVIPSARGPSRSMPRAEVVEQIGLLAAEGFREVVLTGIHLGAWGTDIGEGRLADLLESLLASEEVGRFRLSSIEPMEVDEHLLVVGAEGGERFAHHFHLPLQSGSDPVLERMNRPYRREEYAERVERVREVFPDAAIGADVIVGFPGETEKQFTETLEFVDALPLTYLHVFSYSDRPGTSASVMADKVPGDAVRERSAGLRDLGRRKKEEFERRFVGRELRTLFLHQIDSEGRRVGMTGNYLEVVPEESADVGANEFMQVRPARRNSDGRWQAELGSREARCV